MCRAGGERHAADPEHARAFAPGNTHVSGRRVPSGCFLTRDRRTGTERFRLLKSPFGGLNDVRRKILGKRLGNSEVDRPVSEAQLDHAHAATLDLSAGHQTSDRFHRSVPMTHLNEADIGKPRFRARRSPSSMNASSSRGASGTELPSRMRWSRTSLSALHLATQTSSEAPHALQSRKYFGPCLRIPTSALSRCLRAPHSEHVTGILVFTPHEPHRQ